MNTLSEVEMERLRRFDARESMGLSVYLDLSSPERRDRAFNTFLRQLAPHLDGNGLERKLKDDIELVEMYLKGEHSLRGVGLAIFSCADQFFWRAIPLPQPVPDQVEPGPSFILEPLREIVALQRRKRAAEKAA